MDSRVGTMVKPNFITRPEQNVGRIRDSKQEKGDLVSKIVELTAEETVTIFSSSPHLSSWLVARTQFCTLGKYAPKKRSRN